jgi:hypothetical protein
MSLNAALPEAIGVPVGTVILEDFDKTECPQSFEPGMTRAIRACHPPRFRQSDCISA